MKTLSQLKEGDIFYLIEKDGGYISNIEKKTIDDFYDIKIGRIYHYDSDRKNKTARGFTVETTEFNDYITKAYYETYVCSDKNILITLIEKDKEKFLNKQSKLLKNI